MRVHKMRGMAGCRSACTSVGWVTVLLLAAASPARSQRVAAADEDRSSETRAAEVLRTPVTVSFDSVPLKRGVNLVAAATRLRIEYRGALLDAVTTPVTVHADRQPVGEVLMGMLAGTGLHIVPMLPDIVVIRPASADTHAEDGIVRGVVTDAATKRPVANAAVIVDNVNRNVLTREDGKFTLTGLSEGLHKITVRRVGYKGSTIPVTVKNGETQMVAIALVVAPTVLNDIVTTATGDRRRVEVGNAIATIAADSVVKTTLIRNVSDLLQARVPGMVVQNTSGMVGAPSKIRIRGINSLALNNDPIVILDGIRLNAQTTTAASSQTTTGSAQFLNGATGGISSTAAPSRLDDIDPNTIESIDVLRGPSASSLYGTEAANGVIVIKTKKGQAGAWHLDLLGDQGWSKPLDQAEDKWWGFGVTPNGYLTGGCFLAIGSSTTVAGGTCIQDSVRNFNYENNPEMRTISTGTRQSLGATLSGGSASLMQFFSLRTANNVGMAKISPVQERLISRLWSTPIPAWMKRPNTERNIDASSRTTFIISPRADIALTGGGMYRDVLNGGSAVLTPSTMGQGMSPADTLGFLPSDQQRTKISSIGKRGFVSAQGQYTPRSWLGITGTLGGDYTLRTDGSDLRAQDCTAALQIVQNGGNATCPSAHTVRREETFIKTVNVSAQLNHSPWPWLKLRTSFGEQYNHTGFSSLQAGNNVGSNCNLAFGSSLLSPGPVCSYIDAQRYVVIEARDASAKAGVFLEESIGLFGLYTTFGIRKDASSSFGDLTNKTPPSYPKFDFSYPLSDQSFFPKQSVVSSLRLRLAYGQSGNAASQAGVLNQYSLQQELFNGTPTNVVYLQQAGNPLLKPERGIEWEGGFDVSFLENERIHAEVNLYRKFTRDAINLLNLPPSYGIETPFMNVNLGNVENRGTEIALSGRVLDTRMLAWELVMNYGRNTSKLVHKASSLPSGFGQSRNVEGYPLFGYWGVPVISYDDANHNGILEQNEIAFGEPVYQGSPTPRSEITYVNNITLFNGALHVSANFNQVNDVTTLRYYGSSGGGPRGAVDPTAPLAEQAAWIQAVVNGQGNGVYVGKSSYVRFNELSVTYNVPAPVARRFIRGHSLGLTMAARNLALWTNYVGADPNVSSGTRNDEMSFDEGTAVPQPRDITLRFNLGL